MRARTASIKLTSYNKDVYEPSDDTFVLVDALQYRLPAWVHRPPRLCLEIGCGSGFVICSLAILLEQLDQPAHFLATDQSDHAIQATLETHQAHNVTKVELLQTDLIAGLLPRLEGLVDILVFNPPYVPTPSEEVRVGGIAAAWAGGHNGREVIDRLLPQVHRLLSLHGEFFLVTLPDNDPAGIINHLGKQGLQGRVVLQRSADEELLQVVHCCRENTSNTTPFKAP